MLFVVKACYAILIVSIFSILGAKAQAPLAENRGTMLVLVDQTIQSQISEELEQLRYDLIGDSWKVKVLSVSREALSTDVRAQIQREYLSDPQNLKALYIIGHVPIPYSGFQAPDGHLGPMMPGLPSHWGAWPADVYYTDMLGLWHDKLDGAYSPGYFWLDNGNSSYDYRNRNLEGDGSFDENEVPLISGLKLAVGRVDFYAMPKFWLKMKYIY